MLTIARLLRTFIDRRPRDVINGCPDDSWYWPILEEYRDPQGRTLEEVELANTGEFFKSEAEREEAIATRRWMTSPKSEKEVDKLLTLLEAFFLPDEHFTYLEFGTCFGTTLARVLAHFQKARGIGLEVSEPRLQVTRWLVDRMDESWKLSDRVELHASSILDVPLATNSVNAVFMDTSHIYPAEFEYLTYLTASGVLRKGFVFVVDDPLHSGTDIARRRFIAEQSDNYKILTRPDKNLWWFFAQ